MFQVQPVASLRRGYGGLAFVVAFSIGLAVADASVLPPDIGKTLGNVVRFEGFVDETGQALSATLPPSELQRDPRPWVVSPIYTRCAGTCSAITAGLRRALDESGLAPAEYRVLSFSFDPNETADGLRAFRARMQLPPRWVTLRAGDPQALERTLRALDFRTISIGTADFDHPNLVTVLAPDGRLAGYLFGIKFSPTELARMLRRARAGVSPIDVWRPYLFLAALFGLLASAWVFAVLLSRRRARAMQHGVAHS